MKPSVNGDGLLHGCCYIYAIDSQVYIDLLNRTYM